MHHQVPGHSVGVLVTTTKPCQGQGKCDNAASLTWFMAQFLYLKVTLQSNNFY